MTLWMKPKMAPVKTYLGDGVYIDCEHGRLKLTAEYCGQVDHVIYLEPHVLQALMRWVDRLWGAHADG